MFRSVATVAAWTTLAVACAVAAADPARKKPTGTWERSAGDAKVTFTFKAETLHCVLSSDDATIMLDADYGMTKDGTLFCIVTKVEKQGADKGPAEGDLFRFKVSLEKDKLSISELKPAPGERTRQLLEGGYSRSRD
jgi:hypothetical protein